MAAEASAAGTLEAILWSNKGMNMTFETEAAALGIVTVCSYDAPSKVGSDIKALGLQGLVQQSPRDPSLPIEGEWTCHR